MSVIVERSPASLTPYLPAIEQLANRAVEQNVFYEPLMLMPALEQYAGDAETRFLLVFRDDAAGSDERLCGFVPLQERSHFRGLPCLHLVAFRYPHCYLSTPLLHRDFIRPTLAALLRWVRSQQRYRLLDLPQISADGEFVRALDAVLYESGVTSTTYGYRRTAFSPREGVEAYLQQVLSSRLRKSLRRKSRRLAELGEVAYDRLTSGGNVQTWMEDFLQLEASGWKGRYGTALALSEQDRTFFRMIVSKAFADRRLTMLALRLNGRPIAMLVNFDAAEGGYAFKVAYDEKYRRYSPGVLLDLELIRKLHERPHQWLDLCTDEGNSKFARLFDQSRSVRNLTISNRQFLGDLAVNLLPLVKRARQFRRDTWNGLRPVSAPGRREPRTDINNPGNPKGL